MRTGPHGQGEMGRGGYVVTLEWERFYSLPLTQGIWKCLKEMFVFRALGKSIRVI